MGQKLTVGSLFAGIGGFDLGFERAGFEIKWQVEIDEYAQRVLAKHWPNVRRYGDVQRVHGRDDCPFGLIHCEWCLWPVDVLCGGFPCQDISSSGPRAGIAGAKSGLWREYSRLIRTLRPRYVAVENVADLLGRGIGVVLGDLAALGYDAEWDCVPASYFGYPQARERVWLIAYPCESGRAPGDKRLQGRQTYLRWPDHDRLGEAQAWAQSCPSRAFGVDDGIPDWIHRTGALGNAVIPEVAEWIAHRIKDADASVMRDAERAVHNHGSEAPK